MLDINSSTGCVGTILCEQFYVTKLVLNDELYHITKFSISFSNNARLYKVLSFSLSHE